MRPALIALLLTACGPHIDLSGFSGTYSYTLTFYAHPCSGSFSLAQDGERAGGPLTLSCEPGALTDPNGRDVTMQGYVVLSDTMTFTLQLDGLGKDFGTPYFLTPSMLDPGHFQGTLTGYGESGVPFEARR